MNSPYENYYNATNVWQTFGGNANTKFLTAKHKLATKLKFG